MEKFSLETMLRTAHHYEVAVYPTEAEDKDYSLSREYKTYKGAAAYAKLMSLQSSVRLVEVFDLETDRDYYKEDLCASQEWSGGALYRDGYSVGGRMPL